MPRLLYPEWIKLIARNYLLQLYEKEPRFVQEWNDVKRPFVPLIKQTARAAVINVIEYLLARNPPRDITAWVLDLQNLQDYVQGLQGVSDLSLIRKSYDSLVDQLTPYILKLKQITYNWNLRAIWAGDELMWRDIRKIQINIIHAARADSLFELSDHQIQRMLKMDKIPSGDLQINILSLYLSGGRSGFIKKLNNRLKENEQELKAEGAVEPPSAMGSHANWWFDHYVHNMKYSDIADSTIGPNNKAGRYPENVRKAIQKFSVLVDVEPIERT